MLACSITFYPLVRSHPQVPVVTTTNSRHGSFAHLRHAHPGLAVPGLSQVCSGHHFRLRKHDE